MQGTVETESSRPLSLERLNFPAGKHHIEPFQGGIEVPYDIRTGEVGNYIEAVTVLGVNDDLSKVFVKFYRNGNTAWFDTDRLTDH